MGIHAGMGMEGWNPHCTTPVGSMVNGVDLSCLKEKGNYWNAARTRESCVAHDARWRGVKILKNGQTGVRGPHY